jgi:hypothetical protein
MPFSTLKPRANLDASNDAAFDLAQFFQRTPFSSTANVIPDFGVWFSTTATTVPKPAFSAATSRGRLSLTSGRSTGSSKSVLFPCRFPISSSIAFAIATRSVGNGAGFSRSHAVEKVIAALLGQAAENSLIGVGVVARTINRNTIIRFILILSCILIPGLTTFVNRHRLLLGDFHGQAASAAGLTRPSHEKSCANVPVTGSDPW